VQRALEAHEGVDVFVDTADILPSEEWQPRLRALILSADAVVFVASPASIRSEVCQWELDEASGLNKRIVPLVIEDIGESAPPALSTLNYLFATPGRNLEAAVAELVAILETDIDWLREHTRLGELATRWSQVTALGAQPLRGAELAAAENWLSRQPRSAPDPTQDHRRFIYESRRLANRRQRWTLGGAIFATFILAALAGFAWVQRLDAIEGRQQAEAALREATRAARVMTGDLAGDLEAARVPREMVRSILEEALTLQEELSQNFPDDEALQRSEANSRILVGKVLERQNDDTAALKAYERALAIAVSLAAPPNDTNQNKSILALSWLHISSLHKGRHDYIEAEKAVREALTIYRPPDGVEIESSTRRFRLAETLAFLASILENQGRLDDALKAADEAVAHYEILVENEEDGPTEYEDFPQALTIAGSVRKKLEEYDAAEVLYQRALSVARRNLAADPQNGRTSDALINVLTDLGDLRVFQGDPAAARVYFKEGFDLARADWQLIPGDLETARSFAVMAERLARNADGRDDVQSAIGYYAELLPALRTISANDPGGIRALSDLRTSLIASAQLRLRILDDDAAIAEITEAIEIDIEMQNLGVKLNTGFVLTPKHQLAEALRGNGDMARAREVTSVIRETARQALEAGNTDTTVQHLLASSAVTEGRTYSDEENYAAALPWLEEGVDLFRDLQKTHGLTLYGDGYFIALHQLQFALKQVEHFEEALSVGQTSFDVLNTMLDKDPDSTRLLRHYFDANRLQALLFEQVDKIDEAYDAYLEGLERIQDLILREPENVAWQEDVLHTAKNAAALLFNHNVYDDAAELYEAIHTGAIEMLDEVQENETFEFYRDDSQKFLALSLAGWSDMLIRDGRFGESVLQAERALDLHPSKLLIKSYLANAYMVNGNTEKARRIYLDHRGQTLDGGQLWEDMVRADFEYLRSHGLDRPLMAEVVEAFDGTSN